MKFWQNCKARLRAWLIELVREAIRVERVAEGYALMPVATRCSMVGMPQTVIRASKPVTATVTKVPEKSFEQMQSESLAAQEKYYAPHDA